MNDQKPTLYMVFYDVNYDEDVIEALESCGDIGFSKFERVLGKGSGSDPKMDTSVWPGYNNALFVFASASMSQEVRQVLETTAKKLGGAGIKVIALAAEEIA